MRTKTAEDRKILELLDPVAEAAGLAIVRLRLMGGERRRLQVMAERPADHDITIDECARLSRAFSQVLDAADPITGEYVLAATSGEASEAFAARWPDVLSYVCRVDGSASVKFHSL